MLGSNKECSLLCVKPGLHRVIYGNLIIVNKTSKYLGRVSYVLSDAMKYQTRL